jgi:hypothetical protein
MLFPGYLVFLLVGNKTVFLFSRGPKGKSEKKSCGDKSRGEGKGRGRGRGQVEKGGEF